MINNDNKTWHVYKILRDDEIIYVGVTSNPQERFMSHKRTFGNCINMTVVFTTADKEEALECERDFIIYCKLKWRRIFNSKSDYELKSDLVTLGIERYKINKLGGKHSVIKIAVDAISSHYDNLMQSKHEIFNHNKQNNEN